MAREGRHGGWVRVVAPGVGLLALAACTPAGVPQPSGGSAQASVSPSASPTPQIQAELGTGWELVWNDEFDGAAVDESKWTPDQDCWGGGNASLQCYTDRDKNLFVEDGSLVIRAFEEEFTGPNVPRLWGVEGEERTLPYTSAQVRSIGKGDFTYGRIEVRAKVPGGQGVWPAIWMMPTDEVYGPWPQSGEIDVFEAINLGDVGSKVVYGTLHYGGSLSTHASAGAAFDMTDDDPRADFHTYAIEWAHGEIRWYVDEHHYATQRSSSWYTEVEGEDGSIERLTEGEPFDQDFYLILNVAIGGGWPGSPDETTDFPVQMDVDYVRVFGCADDPETLAACATVDPEAQLVPSPAPTSPPSPSASSSPSPVS